MVVETLDRIKIVPVLVLDSVDEGLEMCEKLCAGGLPAAEITFRTAAAEPVIRAAVKRFPEDEVKVIVDAVSVHSPAEELSEPIRDPEKGNDRTRAVIRLRQ